MKRFFVNHKVSLYNPLVILPNANHKYNWIVFFLPLSLWVTTVYVYHSLREITRDLNYVELNHLISESEDPAFSPFGICTENNINKYSRDKNLTLEAL